MDAAAIQFGSSVRPASGSRGIRLAALIPPVLFAALLLAAITIGARRLAGGMTQPLPAIAYLGAVLAAVLLALGSRGLAPVTLARSDSSLWFPHRRFAGGLFRWLPGVAAVAFAAALSVSGTAVAALVGGWGLVVGEELFAWRRLRRVKFGAARPAGQIAPRVELRTIESPLPQAAATPSWPVPPAAAPSSPTVLQQLTRMRTVDGIDRLVGWLQTSFEPGERTALVHVAFCPPFAEIPRIIVRPSAGPASRIKPSQILAHGVRLELKLNFVSREPVRVLLEFTAEGR